MSKEYRATQKEAHLHLDNVGLDVVKEMTLEAPQKPWKGVKVGSTVHLVGGAPQGTQGGSLGFYKDKHLAAIVTYVHPGDCGLVSVTAFPPGSRDQFVAPGAVKFEAEGKTPGTWHFCENCEV